MAGRGTGPRDSKINRLTPAEVVDLRQRARDGYSKAVLSERYDIDRRYIERLVDGSLRGDVTTTLPPWTPLCMSPKDYQLWRSVRHSADPVPRPCGDCPLSFAKEMSVLGLCNGEPELDGSELLGDWRTAA